METRNVDNVNMIEKRSPQRDNETTSARRYHHGHLRTALIEAGLAALDRGEAGEFSLRAVAREVGVSANAAYRHFADKNALLSAVATEGFRRFGLLQLQAAQGLNDPIAVRTATGHAYIDFARQHPALFRLMFGQFMPGQGNDELHAMAMAAFDTLVSMASAETSAGAGSKAPGARDQELALLTAVARWSLVHGLSHLLLDGQLAIFGERIDEVIHGVLTLNTPLCSPPAKPARPGKAPTRHEAARRR